MPNKQDSNLTSLRFCEEIALKTIPTAPDPILWYPLEPNSYNDFGGQTTAVARNPLNPSRQRRKGTIVDLEVGGGFNQDLTMQNSLRLLQGFFFADWREKTSTFPMNGTKNVADSVVGATHKLIFSSSPTGFLQGHLIRSSGYAVPANNGLFVVASTDGDDITTTAGLADEATPPADAKAEVVGFQFDSGTSAIVLADPYVRLTDSGQDFTLLGLIPGEWVYIGADAAPNRFADNGGFARISAVASGFLEFDKVSWTAVDEAGTGKSIQVFFGMVLRNEPEPANIKLRTYHLERGLGSETSGPQVEYLLGAVANEISINLTTADKVTIDMSFVALDHELNVGDNAYKDGDRTAETFNEEALNTSNDFSRIRVGGFGPTGEAYFGFATELSLTINNNATALKAIGTLGGFDVNVGTFEVGGSVDAYFSEMAAAQAVRAYADATLDFVIAKRNRGLLFDVPLLGFGDGRLVVEQDQPIKLPLENSAAESPFGHTLLMQSFSYLPTVAEA